MLLGNLSIPDAKEEIQYGVSTHHLLFSLSQRRSLLLGSQLTTPHLFASLDKKKERKKQNS